jgi:hypothetical protein
MEPLTLDTLRAMALAQGLALSDAELERLLPLVQAGRSAMDALDGLALDDVEPSSQYRVL